MVTVAMERDMANMKVIRMVAHLALNVTPDHLSKLHYCFRYT